MKDLENIFDDLGSVIDFVCEKMNTYDENSGKPIATYADMRMIKMALEPLSDAIEDHDKKLKRG